MYAIVNNYFYLAVSKTSSTGDLPFYFFIKILLQQTSKACDRYGLMERRHVDLSCFGDAYQPLSTDVGHTIPLHFCENIVLTCQSRASHQATLIV